MIRRSGWFEPAVAGATALTMFLLLFEWWHVGTPYATYRYELFSGGIALGLGRLALLAASVGVQALYFWAALTASWPWRVVYGLVFGAMVFVQYGYVQATGGFLTGHDFEIAAGAPMHWTTMGIHYASAWAVVPVLAFVAALWLVSPSRRPGGRRRGLWLLGLTVVVHAVYAVPLSTGVVGRHFEIAVGQPLLSTQGFARSVVQHLASKVATAYRRAEHGPRTEVAPVTAAAPTTHVVLIVDESMRGDHLSVNGYHRSTTPFLEALRDRGLLASWGIAAATTPYSDDSVLCLLTGIHDLPDRDRRTLKEPTVFQYARAMGYGTHWFDGGTRHLRFGFYQDDLRPVDRWETRRHFGDDPHTDFRIAEAAAEVLKAPSGQFIVILKRGNHLPADANFPADAALWTSPPVMAGRNAPAPNLTDGYDDAIRFNVDRVFEILLADEATRRRTVVLYTSDHGLALGDIRSDGLGRSVLWQEVAVPLLMVGGPVGDVDRGYAAHHANIMPTLLDLMGVPAASRTMPYARSLLTATQRTKDARPVFTGDFFGFGPYVVEDFDRLAAPGK